MNICIHQCLCINHCGSYLKLLSKVGKNKNSVMQHQKENGDPSIQNCILLRLRNIQAHATHGKVLGNVLKIYRGKISRYGSICIAILHVCELIVAENESIVLESHGGCCSEECVIE